MAGKDKDTAQTAKRKLTSKDAYLDEALRSLEEIDAGRHKDSDSYGKVTEALTKLHAATDSFYDAPIGSEAARLQIYSAYETARQMCDAYLEKNKGFRFSSYGRQRQKSILAIRDIIDRDMFVLQSEHPAFSTKKTLKELLETARKSTVIIDDPASVKDVGGSVSTRIPVSIQGEGSQEMGFFTASQKNEDEDRMSARIYERFKTRKGLQEVFQNKDLSEDDRKDIVQSVADAMIGVNAKYHIGITQGDCPATAEEFYDGYERPLRAFFKDKSGEPLSRDEIVKILQDGEVRENLHGLFKETFRSFRGYYYNQDMPKIAAGAEIPTRNVATYRLAARLGMADVVAKAETMDLRVGDKSMSGVFMQTAEGEDLSRLDELSAMRDIFQSGEALAGGMDTARAKRQLCDLQILDYLCGNTDRHEKNFIYQTSVGEDGKTRITGVVGIDNDMSFGTLTDQQRLPKAIIPPGEMRAVSGATYQAVMQMDPAELKNLLGDLGLDDTEIQAAQTRLRSLQTSLSKAFSVNPAMPADLQLAVAQKNGLVLVFNDEKDFERAPFTSFASASGNNYFRKMMDAAGDPEAKIAPVSAGKKRVEEELGSLDKAYYGAPHRWSRGSERKLDEWYETRRSEIQRGLPGKKIPYAQAHRHEPFAGFFAKLTSRKVRRSVDELAKAEKASRKASTTASARSAGAAKHKQQRKSGAKTSVEETVKPLPS